MPLANSGTRCPYPDSSTPSPRSEGELPLVRAVTAEAFGAAARGELERPVDAPPVREAVCESRREAVAAPVRVGHRSRCGRRDPLAAAPLRTDPVAALRTLRGDDEPWRGVVGPIAFARIAAASHDGIEGYLRLRDHVHHAGGGDHRPRGARGAPRIRPARREVHGVRA